MRSQLGFSVLLILILGLTCCTNPSCSYHHEGSTDDEQSSSQASLETNSGLSSSTSSNESDGDSGSGSSPLSSLEHNNNVESNSSHQEKRVIGMPALVSSRELSAVPEQVGGQQNLSEGPISAPANPPLLVNATLTDSSSPEQDKQQTANQEQPASTARGLGSGLMSAITASVTGAPVVNQPPSNQVVADLTVANPAPPNLQERPQQPPLQPQQPSASQTLPPVRPEDLPKIIENNKQVDPEKQQAAIQMSSPGNTSMPTSMARSFDGWTNCVGSSSNKYGTCKNDVDCNKNKGRADGSCMGGFGVCCVMALSCGEKSLENNTFFANPDFPEPSWEARLCEVELKKKHKGILQIMIEFEDFELAPPNAEGECITDVFQVKLSSHRPSPYSLLRVCGQNTGQHLYLDVSQIDEPLILSVATSGGGYPRRWSIRIVQMDDKNYLLAPPGCLQYYTDTVGHFRSFNLGRNLKQLYYAVCFRIDNGYSGIRFTENFFGMNGPFCRKRISTGGAGRYSSSYGAHPHHLVIPPPGYAHPPPKPKFQHEIHSKKFKRSPFVEPYGRRDPRTHHHHHEHEHEHEHEKQFKFEEKEGYKKEGYGPQPAYGGGYGPLPPQQPPPAYGPGYQPEYGSHYYPESKKGEYKSEYKGEYKDKYEHEKFGKQPGHEHESSKSWWSTLGWPAKEEVKEEKKYPYPHYSTYPPTYGQHGSPPPPPTYGSYPAPAFKSGYGPPPPVPYGHPPAYGGDYHHKEIDKFGKQYEHLEYKHEKNHYHKEHEKGSSGSWWPWTGSGKKDDKKDKKDKYYQHHEALFPMMHIPEMPHCEPRYCGQNDVITFPPSGDSISEMCGNKFNRARGPKIISGTPLVVYVSNRGHSRGSGFDINYEQVFYIPRPYQ